MKDFIATATAVGLAFAVAPASAQQHGDGDDIMLNTQQMTMMENWPAERQATYEAWPAEAQAYFWTLNEEQRQGWWMLNDPQRVRIVGMNAQDRATAWRTISEQLRDRTSRLAPSTNTTEAAANTRFVSQPVVQQIPPALNGDYPLCNGGREDSCINPREAR